MGARGRLALGGALGGDAVGGGAQPRIEVRYAIWAGGIAPTPKVADAIRTACEPSRRAHPMACPL